MRECITAAVIWLYSVLLESFTLVALPFAAYVRGIARWDLRGRRLFSRGAPDSQPRVWLHAASLGECKLLCRFLGILTQRRPGDRYVVTAVTKTGVEFLLQHCPEGAVVAGYLPVDTVWRMRAFLRWYRVSRVWLAETELWPSMLQACRLARVPVGVFNGRIEERTMARYRLAGLVTSTLLSVIDVVLAQHEQYAARYVALGLPAHRVIAVGNLKSYVQIRPLPPESRARLRERLGIDSGETVITSGCMHPGEGRVLREAREMLNARGIRARWIIVPRHREAVRILVEELGSQAVVLHAIDTTEPWEVCIIDRYGILDDMYAIADIALVGGTFVSVGGHNVWDAAAYGIPVLFGPVHHTQKSGCVALVSAGVGRMVTGSADIANEIEHLLGDGAGEFIRLRETFAQSLSRSLERFSMALPDDA